MISYERETMKKVYRPGAIGALMDEYERASADLLTILNGLSEEQFVFPFDTKTQDPDCVSIQTIMTHVIDAGYRYALQIKDFFNEEKPPHEKDVMKNPKQAIAEFKAMLAFTVDTLKDKWTLSNDEIEATTRETKWGAYNIEIMLEHAIVHILRHRRQIEKFLQSAEA